MANFGMFTNEGSIALAEKLNEALRSMPAHLTADGQYARVCEICESDPEFNARHGEWRDTEVREAIYAWLDESGTITMKKARATIDIAAQIQISVPTLDGDAKAVLSNRLDEIEEIIEEAIETAMTELDSRVGDASSNEWSGVQVRII